MIADYNTMPHMFWECNRRYFGNQLRTPKFGLMHTNRKLGKFEYRCGEKKKPVKKRYMVILMSDYFDFDEETFKNIIVSGTRPLTRHLPIQHGDYTLFNMI